MVYWFKGIAMGTTHQWEGPEEGQGPAEPFLTDLTEVVSEPLPFITALAFRKLIVAPQDGNERANYTASDDIAPFRKQKPCTPMVLFTSLVNLYRVYAFLDT